MGNVFIVLRPLLILRLIHCVLVELRPMPDEPQTPRFIAALGSAGQQIDLMAHKINMKHGAYAAPCLFTSPRPWIP